MMSYWGRVIGGMAGFAMGGPVGALFGAAIGYAADGGAVGNFAARLGNTMPLETLRIAALMGRRDQVLPIAVTVLAAKLAKCDGAVSRAEIDAFKTSFRIPEASLGEIGRLFDQARDSADGFESYAVQLGMAFADSRTTLEQVLAGLYNIARADGPVNAAEGDFLARVAGAFGLDLDTAQGAGRGVAGQGGEDPYAVLGVDRRTPLPAIRARWKVLVRENHPDSLASQGMPAAQIAAASDRVARINAAYDRIKRDLGPS
jgi:DnaJ like chaperone protein